MNRQGAKDAKGIIVLVCSYPARIRQYKNRTSSGELSRLEVIYHSLDPVFHESDIPVQQEAEF